MGKIGFFQAIRNGRKGGSRSFLPAPFLISLESKKDGFSDPWFLFGSEGGIRTHDHPGTLIYCFRNRVDYIIPRLGTLVSSLYGAP